MSQTTIFQSCLVGSTWVERGLSVLLKDTMQCLLWGWNPQPLNLCSSWLLQDEKTNPEPTIILKRQSRMSSDFVVCLNVLEASFSNSVDTDQTASIGAMWKKKNLCEGLIVKTYLTLRTDSYILKSHTSLCLTHKAPSIIFSRRQFQILLPFQK